MNAHPAPMQLTIDLDAALRKICQRQTLNDVHFAVQLVRHALSHQPTAIHIRTRGHTFTLHRDGEPIDPAEFDLLTTILDNADQATVYDALNRLEREFGIALLSVLVGQAHVDIHSGNRSLAAAWGRRQPAAPRTPIQGTRIRIRRSARQARRENRELRFFCEFCDVPVFLNGKNICRPAHLEDQILSGKVQHRKGSGWMGIPERGSLSRIVFLKRGVRFGSQHFLESSGRVFHALWNASRTEFESDYSASIREGRDCFRDAVPSLYDTLVKHFHQLDRERKNRVKSLILSMDPQLCASFMEYIPIFSSPDSEFDLSIRELKGLNHRYGMLPYFAPPPPPRAPRFPVLEPDDLYFIRTRMRFTPQLTRLSGSLKHRSPPRRSSPIGPDTPQPDAFLSSLNARPNWRFAWTPSPQPTAFLDPRGVRCVSLPAQDRVVEWARTTLQRHPHTVHLLRFRLWGYALNQTKT